MLYFAYKRACLQRSDHLEEYIVFVLGYIVVKTGKKQGFVMGNFKDMRRENGHNITLLFIG